MKKLLVFGFILGLTFCTCLVYADTYVYEKDGNKLKIFKTSHESKSLPILQGELEEINERISQNETQYEHEKERLMVEKSKKEEDISEAGKLGIVAVEEVKEIVK